MFEKVCRACGGALIREGNYLVCEYCQRKELVDVLDDIHAVARANAWEALRKSDFEKAIELFEELVVKNDKDYDSHWGLALARASIVYVNDVIEGKKVPTLNNITEDSFIADKAVKTAISLAPKEIAESYREHAEYIEKVRVEWLEKASKEPPYDVFISFKDSDREHGITRTMDSQTMQDLYTALVEKGYKVFYSRVTLKGKVSEQYEPYIYNAIKTAKVMIVYGEKAEYFNSTWIKNEWMRFKKRVESGEKHKNALVTVFKGVDPYEIPTALTGGRQAIDYSIPSNYEVLLNHVKTIVSESKQAKKLDKIEIKGGQMGKKSSEIKTETLQTREIGSSAVETSIDNSQALSLVRTFVKAAEWGEAEKLLNEMLLENPNDPEARWQKLFVKHKAKNGPALHKAINYFQPNDFAEIQTALNFADKNLATRILNLTYDSIEHLNATANVELLKIILPYNYDERADKIKIAFFDVIEKSHFEAFKALLATIEENAVDEYIGRLESYGNKTQVEEELDWCVEKVLEVDEGNSWALNANFKRQLQKGNVNVAMQTFETLLKYSEDPNAQIATTLKDFGEKTLNGTNANAVMQTLRYYSGDLSNIAPIIVEKAFVLIKKGIFDEAKNLCELAIENSPNLADAYWGLCLIALQSKTEYQIVEKDLKLKQLPEYIKYLSFVDEKRRMECIQLVRDQERAIEKRAYVKQQRDRELEEIEKRKREQAELERKREEAERLRIQCEKEEIERRAKAQKRKKKTIAIVSIVAVIVASIVVFCCVFLARADFNARGGLNLQLSLTNDYYVVESVADENLQSVVIPSEYQGLPVKEIGDAAFYSCSSLTSVEIPDSVTSIGQYAFYYCSSLKSIKYRGTQAQWNAISKGYGWNYSTGSFTITYNYNN